MSHSPVALRGAPTLLLRRLRALGWSHPEWWVVVVAIGAWALLAYRTVGPPGAPPPHHGHVPAPGSELVANAVLMSVAMMAPLTLQPLRRMSLTSLWHRRHRVQVMFLLGYVAAWTAVMLGLDVAAGTLREGIGSTASTGLMFAAAAAWQFAPAKRRALRRCARSVPIAPRGWRADAVCARFGVESAASCAVTCGGIMVAVAATSHALIAMAALCALQLHERIARDYEPSRGALALCVVGAGFLAAPLLAA